MKPSYLPGILLVLATAITNMAMAQQLPPSLQKYERTMPPSVKKAILSMQANPRRSNVMATTAMRPVQLGSMQRSSVKDRERVLAMLLERKANPKASPAQSLANVQRNALPAQTRMMQGRQKSFSIPKSESVKKAEREATAAQVLARLKRKH
jgi:hypothetical protein